MYCPAHVPPIRIRAVGIDAGTAAGRLAGSFASDRRFFVVSARHYFAISLGPDAALLPDGAAQVLRWGELDANGFAGFPHIRRRLVTGLRADAICSGSWWSGFSRNGAVGSACVGRWQVATTAGVTGSRFLELWPALNRYQTRKPPIHLELCSSVRRKVVDEDLGVGRVAQEIGSSP